MIEQDKSWYLLTNGTIDEYCQVEQVEFMRHSKAAVDRGNLLRELYIDMLMEVPEPKTWKEAFEHFDALHSKKIYNIILSKMIKSAEVIDKETDPVKRNQYLEVYKKLEEKLRVMAQQCKA